MLNKPTPTFAAYRSDKTLYPHIERAFLRDMEVQEEDLVYGRLILEDGTEWNLILDGLTEAKIMHNTGALYGICSFQLWKDGTKWAVCRANRAYYNRLGHKL